LPPLKRARCAALRGHRQRAESRTIAAAAHGRVPNGPQQVQLIFTAEWIALPFAVIALP
jgi:hypothetical protein